MARPLVIVYQDLAQPQSEVSTPDLNSVVVGPAYVIKDYPDDAASILLSQTYGLLEQPAAGSDQYAPPADGSDAVTVVSYPDNAPGAIVDRDSVRLFLQLPRVVIGSTYSIDNVPPLGTGVTVFSSTGNENKLSFVGGVDLVANNVRAGDRVIMTSSNSPPQTYVGTVASVGEPNAAGTVTDAASLRLSANIPPAGSGANQFAIGSAGSVEVRIERTLPTQEYVADGESNITFPDAGSDKLVLKGGILIRVSDQHYPLSYARLYLSYRALRQDLTEVDSVTNDDLLLDSRGRAYFNLNSVPCIVDARNPLATGLWIALQNSGSAPIYYIGTQQNDASGHLAARASVDTREDLYAFGPLVEDINILGGYKAEWVNLADPVAAEQSGTPQKFRCVIGSIPLPTASVIAEDSLTGVAQQPSSSTTNLRRTLTLAGSPTAHAAQLLPGDQFTVGVVPSSGTWASRRGTHLISHVNSDSVVEITPGTSRWNDGAAEVAAPVEYQVRSPQGNIKISRLGFLQAMVSDTQGVLFEMRAPTVVGGPFRVQYVNAGGSSVTVSISGFDVTININAGVTTTQNIVDAVNGDAVLSTIMRAGLISTSTTVPSSMPFTALNVYTVGRNIVDTGSTIALQLRNPGTTASPTISFDNSGGSSTGVVITVSGDDITVTYENVVGSTIADVVSGINAHTVARTLVIAKQMGTDTRLTVTSTNVAIDQVDMTYSNIAISTNDDLFLWLFDANARFLTNGVRVGDVLEVPVDPNNYAPNAFEGRVLAFPIAQVISDNRVGIQNNGDDSASSSNELPHYYLRDFVGRLLDNETGTTAAAVRYRIRRALSKDDQVTSIITAAQSLRSKRATICWPDRVEVSDLKDGSRPRTSPLVRAAAAPQPGWVIACQVLGALAGLPVQQGLTNLGLVGVSKLHHSSGYFREAQLTALSNGGVFVMHQRVPGELPYCIHQLTTDPAAIETGELSVVKNYDYISVYMKNIVNSFLGQWNVLPETLSEIQRAVIDGSNRLQARRVSRIGPPLISGEVQLLKVSDVSADRVVLYFKGSIPKPLNGIDFHIVI